MNIHRFAWLLLCMGPLAHAASNPVQACPEFPIPKKLKAESVAQQMDFNGIPMAIRRIEGEQSPESVLAFYREKWAATAKLRGPEEYPVGPWKVIASLRENCFYTVQVKPFGKGGVEGLLGLTAMTDKDVVREKVPTLTGSTVLNDISHNDGGKTARTVLIKNRYTTAANTDFYRRNLTGDGWIVTNHYQMNNPGGKGEVMVLRNGPRELSITATRDGQDANVLLNYVDQP
jgi:hypothetical protein